MMGISEHVYAKREGVIDTDDIREGELFLVCGAMRGGKTRQIVSVAERLSELGRNVQVYSPRISYREEIFRDAEVKSGHIVSRDGPYFPATIVDEGAPLQIIDRLRKTTQVVVIDEAHMFSNPGGLFYVVNGLLGIGKATIVSTLETDFEGDAFEAATRLSEIARGGVRLYGYCEYSNGNGSSCTSAGVHNVWANKSNKPSGRVVTGDAIFKIMCDEHHRSN
jgi:thymidine kinase